MQMPLVPDTLYVRHLDDGPLVGCACLGLVQRVGGLNCVVDGSNALDEGGASVVFLYASRQALPLDVSVVRAFWVVTREGSREDVDGFLVGQWMVRCDLGDAVGSTRKGTSFQPFQAAEPGGALQHFSGDDGVEEVRVAVVCPGGLFGIAPRVGTNVLTSAGKDRLVGVFDSAKTL